MVSICSMAATKLEAQLYVQISNGSLNPFERKFELAGNIGDCTFEERILSNRALHFCKDGYHSCYRTENTSLFLFSHSAIEDLLKSILCLPRRELARQVTIFINESFSQKYEVYC